MIIFTLAGFVADGLGWPAVFYVTGEFDAWFGLVGFDLVLFGLLWLADGLDLIEWYVVFYVTCYFNLWFGVVWFGRPGVD